MMRETLGRYVLIRLPPLVPEGAMYASVLLSWVLTGLVSISYQKVVYPSGLRTPWLDTATFLLDPLLIWGLTVLLAGACLAFYQLRDEPSRARRRTWMVFAQWVGFILFAAVALYVLEQLVFKPTFKFLRPQTGIVLGEPWITGIIQDFGGRLLGLGTDGVISKYQDVPSGFAMRQFMVFYFILWVILQPDFPARKGMSSLATRASLLGVDLLALALVCFSRLYRHNHSVFSLSMAAGVATFFFWACVIISYAVSPAHASRYRHLLSQVLVSYVPFLILFAYASNEVNYWIVFTVVFVVVLFGSMVASYRLARA